MTEHPMDEFDARLVRLMTAYGEHAVGSFDAAAIARTAVMRRRTLGLRLSLEFGARTPLVLAAVVLALLALAAALIGGSRHPSAIGDSFASPTTAAWSPDGSLLAFVVDVADGQRDGHPDTAGATSMATAASAVRPSHPELWVVSGDGGDPRRLATLVGDPRSSQILWARDGRSIVVGVDSGSSAVLVVGLAGVTSRVPLDAGVGDVGLVSLAPTGDRLLYSRNTQSGSDVYVLDLANGSTRRLAAIHASGGCASWSPDARWLLCDVDARDAAGYPTASSATLVLASDGSASHRIGPCCAVGWSADGRALFSPLDAPTGTVYSAAADGTDVRVVPNSDAPRGWTLSPDGSRWAAATHGGLVVARPGSAPTRLTTDPSDQDPRWSPDGMWIAFSSARDGVSGLYAVPAAGGEPRLVASDAEWIGEPWRPSGGRPELTLIRDRAIVTADPEAGGFRDLVSRATIAGDALGAATRGGSASTIVIGPSGPDRDIYHVPVRGQVEVTFGNLSQVSWAPYGGLAEKSSYCAPSSCAVAPGGTLIVTPPIGPGNAIEIWLAPVGADYRMGFPVILDLEASP